ncbi:MAG: hypothetical protein EZS28_007668 [Streblomastix strix]|uniref:Tyr recombinase domain-containing protein n=1 Tax=Streblomastix strix TaxID=222440 RepID=A0A5J4WQF5_9EUKA|nr:MAG: hypothetical protein EZS28_007668 [Streblomastix strix]
MRNRIEINKNIIGMDMEPKGNENKNYRGKKVENDTNIEGLEQRNIQEQKREDKITSSADTQIKLPQTLDKRRVSASNGIEQSENTSIKDAFMERDIDNKQNSNQRIEMVNKENRKQSTRVIDLHNNNMHINNRLITTGHGSNDDIRQSNKIETNEVYVTDNEKLIPILAIFEWIDRLKKQFPKGTDFLLRHKGFNKPTTTKDISLQLTKLLRELKIIRASAYPIRHSAATELVELDIPGRVLTTFIHHLQNSSNVQQYYIFASSTRANFIAGQLTSNPGQDNERLSQVSQQRGKIRREGGNQLLSSSPTETGQ